MTKLQSLAEALLADRAAAPSKHKIIPCLVCGHTFVYRGRQGELSGNFCSLRCQAWYDAGNAAVAVEIVHRCRNGKPMPKTAEGFKIVCAHCRKTSKARVCAAARRNAGVRFVSESKT